MLKCVRLYFASADEPQLMETRLLYDGPTAEIKGVRGSTPGAHIGYATFRWSPAIHALCILFVQTAAAAKAGEKSSYPYLEGGKGSPAASLDFAITKQPNWVVDLFGCDRHGNSYLKHIICRSNSEQKRPGPVRLALRSHVLPPSSVSVLLDGRELSNEGQLKELALRLEHSWEGRKTSPCSAFPHSSMDDADAAQPIRCVA